jgi:hypothetical protein
VDDGFVVMPCGPDMTKTCPHLRTAAGNYAKLKDKLLAMFKQTVENVKESRKTPGTVRVDSFSCDDYNNYPIFYISVSKLP